ncbi:MAG: NAD-dependent epimerase/dehydratase family protein [Flavobacteriales bacterium]|nr:NAD-dependent epimerase/dehydratase family protein [Flavobacteriales bacterium]
MILVTGGTGLVGSHLLFALLQKGENVTATYRTEESLTKTLTIFSTYGDSKLFDKILWVQADVSDYFALKSIFDNINYVYHCAAVVSFDRRVADKMFEINIEGTKNLINLSLEHKINKFCYVSSVAALGNYTDKKCSDEDAPWEHNDEVSNYSVSKYYAENEVWRGSEEGLDVVIVNPATIIGYGDWEESSTAIIKKVNDGLNFYTPGSNAFVGVNDVVKAMLLLMNTNVINERYILVSENWTFKKLFEEIAKGLGKKIPSKEAPRSIANILRRLDEIRYFLLGTKTVLTKQSVATAFKKQCYSAEKIKTELKFEFEPMERVIQEATANFK